MRKIKLHLYGLFFSTLGLAFCVHADDLPGPAWSTDVIGITEMQLSANYWIDHLENPGQLLMDQAQIAGFNKAVFSTDENMVDLTLFPEQLAGASVKEAIEAISTPGKAELYSPSGELLGPEGYRTYRDKLGLDNITATVKVQFALTVKRADMRTYPTDDRYYRTGENQDLDRFQENGLFPGDALALLHTSVDREWCFVQSYNYAAWVRCDSIAAGDRHLIETYKNAGRFLVVTGDKVRTSFNPELSALSELQLDMGIRIPLAERDTYGNDLYGQNPFASYTVLLPVRNRQGRLEIKPALIARSRDVSQGYLPFTRENILRQAFKFLGERYGWGHSYNARDCTGFVMEVYKTFGIHMPRNTGQQGAGRFGKNTRFTPESSRDEKLEAVQHLDVGDLIYVPGHVLMYIGNINGEPYVIHDVSVFRYIDENGKFYEGTLNGVSVTPLIPLYGSRKSPYIDLIYNIKRLR
jgi:hypothetical protein